MNLVSLWKKYVPDWKCLLLKSLPYVLVVVFTSATVFAAFGVQENQREQAAVENAKADLATQKQELETALQQTKDLIDKLGAINTQTQTLLEQAQNQESNVTEKIEQLRNAYESVENKEQQRWVLPMQYKLCTSSFGNREHPIAGEAKFHYGVDLAAAHGTPIVASRSGTVIIADYEEGKAGYHVVIDHLDGYESKYMHMDKYIVSQGQFVVTGQVIGYCGQTGAATGDHLHFEIWKNNDVQNPADFVDLY